jgi:hypothetical protein
MPFTKRRKVDPRNLSSSRHLLASFGAGRISASAGADAMTSETTPLLSSRSGNPGSGALPRFGNNAPQAKSPSQCARFCEEDEVIKACNVFGNVYVRSLACLHGRSAALKRSSQIDDEITRRCKSTHTALTWNCVPWNSHRVYDMIQEYVDIPLSDQQMRGCVARTALSLSVGATPQP